MKNPIDLKKILAAILITAVAFSIFLPAISKSDAYAADTYEIYLEDINDVFTYEQSQSIEKSMQTAADAARCNLGIYVVSDIEDFDNIQDYAFKKVLVDFKDNALVMVCYKDMSSGSPEYYSAINTRGNAEEYYYKYHQLTSIVETTAAEEGDEAAVKAFCEMLTECGEERYGSSSSHKPQSNDEYKNSSDELLIRGGTYKAALADYDDCLTPAQEENVLDMMEETAKKVKCNVGIVITRDIGNQNHVQYAESFLDDNFGITSDSIVLLLLNTHDNPKYISYRDWISLSGRAERKLQKYVDDIFDETYYALDKNGASPVEDFDSACIAFCKSVKLYGGQRILRFLVSIVQNPAPAFTALIMALIISVTVTAGVASKYKKKKPISASQYIDRRTVNVTYRRDDFIREYTTSTHIESSHRGGGHGGGGGGGGHHGGGGGRHR